VLPFVYDVLQLWHLQRLNRELLGAAWLDILRVTDAIGPLLPALGFLARVVDDDILVEERCALVDDEIEEPPVAVRPAHHASAEVSPLACRDRLAHQRQALAVLCLIAHLKSQPNQLGRQLRALRLLELVRVHHKVVLIDSTGSCVTPDVTLHQ